ncbi:unnamed protein product [Acanthosepion pharaonis]|uniref:Uncharacterized protein n=1 Tax=Acanthosepion pharaonis TaxID=158019 RepID=A0A812E2W3_ACAPH|nr:unnamed protein product [Sepia pharaonis]
MLLSLHPVHLSYSFFDSVPSLSLFTPFCFLLLPSSIFVPLHLSHSAAFVPFYLSGSHIFVSTHLCHSPVCASLQSSLSPSFDPSHPFCLLGSVSTTTYLICPSFSTQTTHLPIYVSIQMSHLPTFVISTHLCLLHLSHSFFFAPHCFSHYPCLFVFPSHSLPLCCLPSHSLPLCCLPSHSLIVFPPTLSLSSLPLSHCLPFHSLIVFPSTLSLSSLPPSPSLCFLPISPFTFPFHCLSLSLYLPNTITSSL